MRRTSALPSALLTGLLLTGCPHEAATPSAPSADNVLLSPSPLPLQFPPFHRIRDADFRPAFDAGLAQQLEEVAAIAHSTDAPTFENTIVALERSGQLLTRVSMIFNNLNASNTDDALQALDATMSPRLAAQYDAIYLDADLFARVDAVYQARDGLHLDAESAQLLNRTWIGFVRAGAKLSPSDKKKLKKLNERISTLQTTFEQNARKAMSSGGLVIDDVQELDGLSADELSSAAEAAKAKGMKSGWVLSLQNTTIQPALAHLTRRDVRERLQRASEDRAAVNLPIVSELVRVRAEKGALLGYPTYAAFALADETAGTPAEADRILHDIGAAALAKAKEEAADIQAAIDAEAAANHTPSFTVQPWDWAFYTEKVRKSKLAYDEAEVKPYFELERVLNDGLFYAAHEMYGITFKRRTDLPVYQPDVLVYEVDDVDGSVIGLFILDLYQRDNKQGGAWMDNYVGQSSLFGTQPVVVNNLNVPKPAPGQPVLLSFDDVNGMFHEFGHGLNGLFSRCTYPSLSGTATPPDFVEYPSQFNEMWLQEPAVLSHYARNYQTGEPMPKELFDKVLAGANFGGGFGTLEYIEAAAIDMAWHELPADAVPAASGVMAFEADALKKAGLDFAPVPPRYHTPYFNHAFTGGYEAGYYAYLWSEVLARDTGAWFHDHGGMTRENGDRYRTLVLSRGRTVEPSVMFQEFYGAPPDARPLVLYRGLTSK